ncbi:MAG: dUTP diphosphatase [Elusimicrobia bacterium]|nr:dUTP diphosphatase [Elusimicrobiota bacterium]
MAKEVLPILKLHRDATLPTRAHPDDAGLDLYSLEEVALEPGRGSHVKTGVAVELPPQTVGLIADRSSMARRGLKTAGGVIDAGYRGEIGVLLWNISPEAHTIKRGDRIAQLLVVSVHTPAVREVVTLNRTERGEGGFGSTGR